MQHHATVEWERGTQAFTDQRYQRAHHWAFDGGTRVAASSSPQVVPLPYSDPYAVDPEEAFVAALSSCHMLWFLGIAAGRGFIVDRYRDQAVGHMRRDHEGRMWIARVELHPVVEFSGSRTPDAPTLAQLHHDAHSECFLARSVRSEVVVVDQTRLEGDDNSQ